MPFNDSLDHLIAAAFHRAEHHGQADDHDNGGTAIINLKFYLDDDSIDAYDLNAGAFEPKLHGDDLTAALDRLLDVLDASGHIDAWIERTDQSSTKWPADPASVEPAEPFYGGPDSFDPDDFVPRPAKDRQPERHDCLEQLRDYLKAYADPDIQISGYDLWRFVNDAAQDR